MQYTYSIIIPHKNIPHLLQRCLNSIPQRDDLQVIIVDDNSDKDKVDFKHFPGHDRSDVEILLTKDGKGAGYARNVGLDKAQGKWIVFSDADDFFHEGMLRILDQWRDCEFDIVYFNVDTVDNDTLKNDYHRFYVGDLNNENELRYNYHFLWGRMFRKKLIDTYHIRCNESLAFNDIAFACQAGDKAKRIVRSNECLYCYVTRNMSLIHICSLPIYISQLEEGAKFNAFCREKGLPYRRNLENILSKIYHKLGFTAFSKAFYVYIKQNKISAIVSGISKKIHRKLKKTFNNTRK